MTFLILVAVVVIAYLMWRVVDQLPDIVYRLSEIQRELSDLRRRIEDDQASPVDAGGTDTAAESAASPNAGNPDDE